MRPLALSLLCVALAACLPPGSKLLNMEVVSQGEVLFETSFDVADSSDEADIWAAAGQCPFSLLRQADSLSKPERPEAGHALVELEGAVVISITWGADTVEAQAELDGATVQRCSGPCPGWHLTQETVRRAMEANGL